MTEVQKSLLKAIVIINKIYYPIVIINSCIDFETKENHEFKPRQLHAFHSDETVPTLLKCFEDVSAGFWFLVLQAKENDVDFLHSQESSCGSNSPSSDSSFCATC